MAEGDGTTVTVGSECTEAWPAALHERPARCGTRSSWWAGEMRFA
jgi:hypothetical protein